LKSRDYPVQEIASTYFADRGDGAILPTKLNHGYLSVTDFTQGQNQRIATRYLGKKGKGRHIASLLKTRGPRSTNRTYDRKPINHKPPACQKSDIQTAIKLSPR
jgi:hypothetical protein